MSAAENLGELVVQAFSIVAVIGVAVLLLFTNFDSTAQTMNNLNRFVWALTHSALPTTTLGAYLDVVLMFLSGVAITKDEVKLAIVGGFAFYFLINFVDAWFAAPVVM